MDIILHPPIVIILDEEDIAKNDDEVHNELNTLFTSSMNLDDNSSMKSGKLGDNPISTLVVIPLAIFLPLACYIDPD
jgi:hypothetical protein